MSTPIYQSLKNSQSKQKNSQKNRVSIEGTKNVISIASNISIPSVISDNCMKRANQSYQISACEHYLGYSKLQPYLQLFKSLNPGFNFSIEKYEENNEFKRLAILFPYSISAAKHCFKVYGIDAAHIAHYEIKNRQREYLKQLVILLPKLTRIAFKKCYIFALTGRTVNNEMILFGLCISYSESMENYEFFFQFLQENEVNCIIC